MICTLFKYTKGFSNILDGGLVKIVDYCEIKEDDLIGFTKISDLNSTMKFNELTNGVELFWDNDSVVNQSTNASTEIYGSLSPNLYISVTSIASNILSTATVHELVPGMPIYPIDNYNTQIDSESIYYVLTTPTTNTFTLTSLLGVLYR